MPSGARSLRLKLTAWFVLVFFAIQTTLVVGVVLLRREAIQGSLDDALTDSAVEMVDSVLAAESRWTLEDVESNVPKDADFVLFAIRDDAGRILVSSGVIAEAKLAFTALDLVPAGPFGGVHRRLGPEQARELTGEAQTLRLITLPFRRGGELYYFQAAVRDPALWRVLGPFFDLVVLGIPVGVVAALIAAWIIGGRAVAPIQQLSRAAQSVSPTSLGERIDVPSTDREITRLEGELNSALARLEEGYRAQDQFISNVSHELRTPVAVLLTQAQVARMGKRDAKKAHAFVERAEVLLKRLGRVVESFLVLARADLAGAPPRKPVPVIDLVLGSVQTCRDVAEQNRVHLVPRLGGAGSDESDLTVLGDAELLQTMLENLVRNAISHSPPEGEVALEAEREGDAVELVVRDQGPGIPEEYLERIFDRFVRVPEGSARRDGTGLGLAIADGVARLHGGSIRVRNNADAGCSFTVRLPAGDADGSAS